MWSQRVQRAWVDRPAPLWVLLKEAGELAGHPRSRDRADLTATILRTVKISSERFHFEEKNESACEVELCLVPPAPVSASGHRSASKRMPVSLTFNCKNQRRVPSLPCCPGYSFSRSLRGISSQLCSLGFCDAESRIPGWEDSVGWYVGKGFGSTGC